MRARSCNLIDPNTGEKLYFGTMGDAEAFLGRKPGYMHGLKRFGRPAISKKTHKKYKVEYGELRSFDIDCDGHSNTLCWDCKNASGRCSWSQSFTPVEGWQARKTHVNGNVGDGQSYLVEMCPLFAYG